MADEWLGENGFLNYRDWALANGYDESMKITRKDFTKDFTPENCIVLPAYRKKFDHRLFDKKAQKLIKDNAKKYDYEELAEIVGVTHIQLLKYLGTTYLHQNNEPWKDWQLELLEKWYGIIPIRSLPPMIGKSREAILGKAKDLGLGVNKRLESYGLNRTKAQELYDRVNQGEQIAAVAIELGIAIGEASRFMSDSKSWPLSFLRRKKKEREKNINEDNQKEKTQ